MSIRIRKDIFTDSAFPNNTTNLQENPMTTVQPMKAEKPHIARNTNRTEKQKNDTQEGIPIDFDNTKKLMKTVKLIMGGKKPQIVVNRNKAEKFVMLSNTNELIQNQGIENESKTESEKDQYKNSTDTEDQENNTIDNGEDWFDARKFLLQMNSSSNKRQKLSFPNCSTGKDSSDVNVNVKDVNATSTTATENSKKLRISNHTKDATTTEISTSWKFSNNTKDVVQTICQLCKVHYYFVNMRVHTRKVHKLSISDYKAKYGNLDRNIVEEIYHKCGICSKALLFDSDSMVLHTKKHGLTHKEYSSRYLTLVKPQHAKSSEPKEKSYKDHSAQELLEQLQYMIAHN